MSSLFYLLTLRWFAKNREFREILTLSSLFDRKLKMRLR